MEGPPRRYSGFAYPQGLLVLDEATGEVLLVPADGSATRRLHAGSGTAQPAELPSPATLRAVGAVHTTTLASPAVPRRGVPSVELPAVPSLTAPDSGAGAAGFVVELTELDRDVIASYPYPVAVVYARLFAETDPRQRCRLLVDTFATLLKTWALTLASEYLNDTEVRDAALNDLLVRDFQRPLISVWHLFSSRALAVFRAERKALFTPELATAYEVLETKCRKPFLARTRFEDAKGETRTRESKLGKIQALIKYRNGLAHGYNLAPARAEQHLATYLPVLREILAEARFMKRYPLFYIAPGPRDPAGAVVAYRLMGSNPSATPERLEGVIASPQASPLFLLDGEKRALSLDGVAIVDASEQAESMVGGVARDVFLFEGNTRSAIVYASALGEHVEKQHQIDRWRSLLEGKAVDIQLLRKDRLDLPSLRSAAQRITSSTLHALVACGKFLPEIAYRPPAVRERLSQFELGDHRGVVFVGEGGSGKSTLAASVAAQQLESGDVVLFYRASSLLDGDLQSRIVRDLGVRDLFFEDFLDAADPLFIGEVRLRVVVDGVNEHPGDVAVLIGSIDAMVRQAADHPWFRLLATARTAAYERLPPEARFGALEGTRYLTTEERNGARTEVATVVPLLPLTNEEVGEVYERYRAYRKREGEEASDQGVHCFRPNTDYQALVERGRSTVAMMRSPLMMRLLVVAFHGRDLKPELSYDEAMRLYFDHVVVGTTDPAGPRWERGAFLKAIVSELDAASSDSIDRDALYQVPALKRGMQTTQKDSPYVQLLDLGVLTELWDKDRCFVRFGFDRLCEFLLAELHQASCRDAYGVLDLVRRSAKFGALSGALVVALAAQCRAGNPANWVAATKLADSLPASAPERGALASMGQSVVERLAREAGTLAPALAALRGDATIVGTLTLLNASNALFLHGEVEASAAIVAVASVMAEQLGDKALAIRALYGIAVLRQHRGELDEALGAYRSVTELARANGDNVSAERAAVKQSEILRSRNADEALRLLEGAVAALRDAGALGDAAEARRQQAIIAVSKSRLADAAVLADDAVAIARLCGQPNVETQCFITRGIVAWRQGDLRAASGWFERALRVAESEGHVRNMAMVAGNLGILARERGDFASAVRYGAKQLDMSQRIQDRRSSASALHNLGVFYFEAGDIDGAARSLEQGRLLLTEMGDMSHVATALVNQAALEIHRGSLPAAIATLGSAVDVAHKHGNEEAAADAVWLRASLAIEQNDRESSRVLRDRLASMPGGTPRRAAQVAALDLRLALASADVARAVAFFAQIEGAFRDASPLPEVHELPVDAAVELASACVASGETNASARAIAAASAWLRGRPHRRAGELAELAERSPVAASG